MCQYCKCKTFQCYKTFSSNFKYFANTFQILYKYFTTLSQIISCAWNTNIIHFDAKWCVLMQNDAFRCIMTRSDAKAKHCNMCPNIKTTLQVNHMIQEDNDIPTRTTTTTKSFLWPPRTSRSKSILSRLHFVKLQRNLKNLWLWFDLITGIFGNFGEISTLDAY